LPYKNNHKYLQLFCHDDQVTCCFLCANYGAHKGHKIALCNEAARDLRTHVDSSDTGWSVFTKYNSTTINGIIGAAIKNNHESMSFLCIRDRGKISHCH
jgi:hypothetical protein